MGGFTKGPWVVDQEDEVYITQQNSKEDISIAYVLPIDKGGPKDYHRGHETVANARLIASAPDLLEALERMIAPSHDGGPNVLALSPAMMVRHIEAAIARARGIEE